jgi:hypothetical protein
MGVAPEAIVEFIEYRLKHICCISYMMELIQFFTSSTIIGCATSAPDGSSPEAIKGCLQPVIGSNLIIYIVRLLY